MGVKFQSHPHDEPSQIIIHVRMLDAEASLQQEALGIIGVNLCYGAFFLHHEPEQLIESLLDKLTTGRIEIDMIEFNGIEFRYVDNRVMALKLVQLGLSGAAMFGRESRGAPAVRGAVQEGGAGRARQLPARSRTSISTCWSARWRSSAPTPRWRARPILPLMEITMRNLLAGGTEVDRRDFLARADLLAACGMTVLISDYFEYYRLAAYLAWRTKERIGIVHGRAQPHRALRREILHAAAGRHSGKLRALVQKRPEALRLSAAPAADGEELQTVDTLEVAPELRKLYGYLADRGSFVQLDNYNPEYLHIFSRDVLKRIAAQRRDLGADGAAASRGDDQEARLLRLFTIALRSVQSRSPLKTKPL